MCSIVIGLVTLAVAGSASARDLTEAEKGIIADAVKDVLVGAARMTCRSRYIQPSHRQGHSAERVTMHLREGRC